MLQVQQNIFIQILESCTIALLPWLMCHNMGKGEFVVYTNKASLEKLILVHYWSFG